MKPEFEDIDVECWDSGGMIGTATPEICLLHSTPDRGRVLLRALEELASEAPNSKRKLTLKPSRRKQGVSTLRLRLVSLRPEL